MVQEFGTVPSVLTGRALILEHMIHNYYSQNVEDSITTKELSLHASEEVLGAAFYPQRTKWRISVLERGINALQQAMFRSSHYTHLRHSQERSVQDSELDRRAAMSEESISMNHNNANDSMRTDEL